jgi:hypothetical protein
MENEAEEMETAALHRSRKHAGVQLDRYRLTRGSMAHAAAATRRVEQVSKFRTSSIGAATSPSALISPTRAFGPKKLRFLWFWRGSFGDHLAHDHDTFWMAIQRGRYRQILGPGKPGRRAPDYQ